jgi:biotin carboxyl carrier protein
MEEQKITTSLVIDDTVYTTKLTTKYRKRKPYTVPSNNEIIAFIPGIIREILVKKGQVLREGEGVMILEAMKMKNLVQAHRNGRVKEIKVKIGDMVLKNQALIEFDPLP